MDVVRLLRDAGANPNAAVEKGDMMPLMRPCVQDNSGEMMEVFVASGEDPTVPRESRSWTLPHAASSEGNLDPVQLSDNVGVNLNVVKKE